MPCSLALLHPVPPADKPLGPLVRFRCSLMNLFTRGVGGLVSDWASKFYGMQGRLWVLWIGQVRMVLA